MHNNYTNSYCKSRYGKEQFENFKEFTGKPENAVLI
jgi:hypothetical protein